MKINSTKSHTVNIIIYLNFVVRVHTCVRRSYVRACVRACARALWHAVLRYSAMLYAMLR